MADIPSHTSHATGGQKLLAHLAMIAFAALLRHLAGEHSPLQGDIHPNLPLV